MKIFVKLCFFSVEISDSMLLKHSKSAFNSGSTDQQFILWCLKVLGCGITNIVILQILFVLAIVFWNHFVYHPTPRHQPLHQAFPLLCPVGQLQQSHLTIFSLRLVELSLLLISSSLVDVVWLTISNKIVLFRHQWFQFDGYEMVLGAI